MNKKNLHKGFSLLEIVLYIGIFVIIIGGSLFGILTNVTRVSTREISGSEVSNQLQFAMETVSRLVRESSNVESATTTATTTLKLRMADPLLDPTCVFLDNGVLKLSQGPDASLPQNCKSESTALTTDKVVVDSALFKRVEFPGGHDLVAVDFQFSNTASGASKISRALHSGISRVSAATFDSDLLPNVDNSYEVGFSGAKRWKNISISNLLNLGVIAGDPAGIDGSIYYNSTDKTFRGKANGTWSNLGSSLWIATSTNAMYAGVSGNVGIGTMSPAYKLQVAGDVGATAFYYASDRRLKDEIKNIEASDAKNKIMQLQGVSFVWKESGKRDMGLIAQEVETIYPELVSTSENSTKSIHYAGLIAPLIETVKMQQKEIDDLKRLISK